MSVLKEHQFEILPSEDAADGFVFGIGAEVSLDEAGFDPGETTWQTQDGRNSRSGTDRFGRDVTEPRTWTWSSFVDREDVEGAVDTLERFSTAWAPHTLVEQTGANVALRYRLAGRTRRVIGRPRRFAAPPTNLILSGYVPVTHDFACVDSYTYDDEISNLQFGFVSVASGGGVRFPSAFPLVTTPSTVGGGGAVGVGGTAKAYPTIRFNGPWTNPVLTTPDWTLALKGSIPDGDWVEIDARPHVRTVLRSSGASAADYLDTRTVWLEDLWFAPGTLPQVSLGGSAPDGANLNVTWRNTWNSI